MSDSVSRRMGPSSGLSPYGQQGTSANLADILERVLDKGIVIAGDIKINLLDIELLTIKLRLLVASVDKAKEMGIDWWEHDPSLSSSAHRPEVSSSHSGSHEELARENERLREEIERMRALEPAAQDAAPDGSTRHRVSVDEEEEGDGTS